MTRHLQELTIHFFSLSLTSFGGVSASVLEMHRIFVGNLRLISNNKFLELYAISQAAPGPNLLFVVLLGWKIEGIFGALVSLFSMTTPASILAITADQLSSKFKDNNKLIQTKKILAPITIALFLSSGLILLKNSIHFSSILLAATTILVLWKFRINPIWMLIFGAILGFFGLV